MAKLKVNKQRLSQVCQKYDVIAVYLHGSRAKGYAAPDSDTDVAIVVKDRSKLKRGAFSSYNVAGEIEDILSIKEPDIRVVDRSSSPIFLFEIISCAEVLYQKNALAKLSFEEKVLESYYDTEHMRDIYRDYLYSDIKARAHAN